jgi:hypothetical protein
LDIHIDCQLVPLVLLDQELEDVGGGLSPRHHGGVRSEGPLQVRFWLQ